MALEISVRDANPLLPVKAEDDARLLGDTANNEDESASEGGRNASSSRSATDIDGSKHG
jgi:hypothetical protein